MAYPSPSTINASAGIGEIFYYLNDVTKFWFSNMFLVAVFLIFLVGYLRSGHDDLVSALSISSYVTFVVATMLWLIGFVSILSYILVIGVTLMSTAWLLIDKKDN